MEAEEALRGLMTAIDEHRWADLKPYLHPAFVCRLVHTEETFDRDGWIRFNAGYPGFERLRVEELVAGPDGAACRSHVTARDGHETRYFACASFTRMQNGLIVHLTEVWTDLEQPAPAGTRESRSS